MQSRTQTLVCSYFENALGTRLVDMLNDGKNTLTDFLRIFCYYYCG